MMKTRNPGYQPGNHWVVCDRCGFDWRVEDVREEWNGYVTCPYCWESRHPQDFVRGVADDSSAQGYVRTEPTDGVADERPDGTTVSYEAQVTTVPSGNDFGNGDDI